MLLLWIWYLDFRYMDFEHLEEDVIVLEVKLKSLITEGISSCCLTLLGMTFGWRIIPNLLVPPPFVIYQVLGITLRSNNVKGVNCSSSWIQRLSYDYIFGHIIWLYLWSCGLAERICYSKSCGQNNIWWSQIPRPTVILQWVQCLGDVSGLWTMDQTDKSQMPRNENPWSQSIIKDSHPVRE